ncbi:hypothetical protein [Gluconobacter sphaericus]|nr:hypothetical protein [Gluconobacter sphaericus]MBF0886640.1 hypothetical protein [Gluconobacter sphaericus]GEB44045.1 hypothetical protein GSP01_28270 [Gluconobacter sphaericus NBRC 12467]
MSEPFRAAPISLLLFLPMTLIFARRLPREQKRYKPDGKNQQTSPGGMQKALPDHEKNGCLKDQSPNADYGLS